MASNRADRLLELDSLRGLAAIAVVLFHYYYRYDEIYGHSDLPINWARYGHWGVELFFIVSGFVIYWTLNRIEKPVDFLISRFSRLYPVYWASALITFLIVGLFGLPGREVSIVDAGLNLLMVQEYLFIPHIDGVYWTLTVELTFYFWMFVLFCCGQKRNAELWFVPVLLLFVAKQTGVNLYAPISKVLIVDHIPFFLSGICFYKIHAEVSRVRSSLILLMCLFALFLANGLYIFTFIALLYLTFGLAISGHIAVLRFKPLVFLGGISYALYLVHQNIGYVIINSAYNYGVMPELGILFAFLLSLLLAYLLTAFVEKPSLRYIRYLYRQQGFQTIASKFSPLK